MPSFMWGPVLATAATCCSPRHQRPDVPRLRCQERQDAVGGSDHLGHRSRCRCRSRSTASSTSRCSRLGRRSCQDAVALRPAVPGKYPDVPQARHLCLCAEVERLRAGSGGRSGPCSLDAVIKSPPRRLHDDEPSISPIPPLLFVLACSYTRRTLIGLINRGRRRSRRPMTEQGAPRQRVPRWSAEAQGSRTGPAPGIPTALKPWVRKSARRRPIARWPRSRSQGSGASRRSIPSSGE